LNAKEAKEKRKRRKQNLRSAATGGNEDDDKLPESNQRHENCWQPAASATFINAALCELECSRRWAVKTRIWRLKPTDLKMPYPGNVQQPGGLCGHAGLFDHPSLRNLVGRTHNSSWNEKEKAVDGEIFLYASAGWITP
jgi:hypothetical protein